MTEASQAGYITYAMPVLVKPQSLLPFEKISNKFCPSYMSKLNLLKEFRQNRIIGKL